MMKKTALTFAALTAAAASFAAAENLPAGGEGAFPGLQEVQYQGVKPSAKNDDRTKFVYVADSVNAVPAAAPAVQIDALAAEPAEGTPVTPLLQDSAAQP